MSTALVPFDTGAPPAVLAGRQSNSLAAAKQGVQASFPVIGYKGRNWRIKFRGEDTLLTSDGRTPIPNLDAIIVGVSPGISKQYYAKKYTEGSDEAPDCFSLDGIAPDASVQHKQCATCSTCSMNAWGSRMTDDGKKAKACQDSRRLAVVPLHDIKNEQGGGPMLLRLPPMSLTNLANYATLLERKGAGGMEFVATRLGFDYDVAYPRITFEALGWLTNEQAIEVVGEDGQSGVCADPNIDRMLHEMSGEAAPAAAPIEQPSALDNGGPAAAMAARVAESLSQPAPQPEPAPVAVAPVAAPMAAPVPAKRQRAAAPVAAAPVAAQPVSGGFAGGFGGAAPVATAPVAAAPVAAQPVQQPAMPATEVAEAPDDLQSTIDDLLAGP